MISNIVVSLFGAAYNWPLGAAISFCMLVLVVGLLFLSEHLEKKWSFSMSATPQRAHAGCLIHALAGLRISLPADRRSDHLFLQRPRRRGISAAQSHSRLVSQLFADDAIWDSVLNSLHGRTCSVAISLTFGIPAALALDRANFPGKALFRRLVLLPLILPGIITGLSLADVVSTQATSNSACSQSSWDTAPHSSRLPPPKSSPACKNSTAPRKKPPSIWEPTTGRHSGASPCQT